MNQREQETPAQADSSLASRFAEISQYLLSASTIPEVLRRIVDLAATTVDGCDYALIHLSDRPRRKTR